MKSIYYYTGLILMIAFSTSCMDFLEVPTKNFVSDDVLWSTESNADLFLNDIYNKLPNIQDQTQHLDQYTDNSDVGSLWMEGVENIGNAQITPDNYPDGLGSRDNFTEGMWHWEQAYERIRKCNIFIKNVTEAEALSDEYKTLRVAEARFVRALSYHWMWMTYGGVPLLTYALNNQDASLVLEHPRATAEETFKFIQEELGAIAAILPETVSANDQGRATKGAALTVKGWCELFHASILRNHSNDIERWKNAAKTNKEVIEMGVYDLAENFNELFMENNNIESIFARQYGPDKGSKKEGRLGPVLLGSTPAGWGNFQPTQQLVDEFSMANGLAIYETGSGYDPQNPYEGREKRFYETIIYDNSMWGEYLITTRVGGNNPIDLEYNSDYTHTGYYAHKRLNTEKDPSLFHDGKSYENYMFFRFAEVLLNFAEAENEVNGPTSEVLAAVNRVRTRSNNLPTVEATYGTVDQDQMREIIRRERRVELCFEDKRWWDILRWKIAEQLPDGSKGVINCALTGMQITENPDGTLNYKVVEVRDRKFLPKMYTMPIPQTAIDRNSVMAAQNGGPDNWTRGQNPGY